MRCRPLGVLGLALSILSAVPASAVEPLSVSEIAPGIFVHAGEQAEASPGNKGGIANVGFIVGDSAVMVVDTGGSAAEGARLRAAIRHVTRRPIRYVVLTHVHPDHIFGTAAFAGDAPEVIGHAKLPGALAQRGDYYLRNLRRALGAEAEGSGIVTPTRLVADRDEVDLGNRPIALQAHATAHTDNDLSLFDRKTATLWLGDLLFVDRIPALDGSIVGWLRELKALEKIPAARAVPGHGPPSVAWPLAAAPEKRYLEKVLEDTRAAIKEGVDIGGAWRRVAMGEKGRWLLFDEYHPRNVTTAYKELEWE
jgi:quinoprotein relay system zinc metallohydrolase 2